MKYFGNPCPDASALRGDAAADQQSSIGPGASGVALRSGESAWRSRICWDPGAWGWGVRLLEQRRGRPGFAVPQAGT
jgi:hypothetical protein